MKRILLLVGGAVDLITVITEQRCFKIIIRWLIF